MEEKKWKTPDYATLAEDLFHMIADVPYLMADLANASALLADAITHINWIGFYLIKKEEEIAGENGAKETKTLILGPFQGRPACVEIPVGKGVCGTAAAQDRVQIVPDVHAFSGHIPCDSASASEIVLPIHEKDRIVGVLDVDSPYPGRFSEEDGKGLLLVVKALEKALYGRWKRP